MIDDNKSLVANFLNKNWPEEDQRNNIQVSPDKPKMTLGGQKSATAKTEEYGRTIIAGKGVVKEMFELKREVGKLNNVHIAIGTDKINLQNEFLKAKQIQDALLNQGELQEEQRKTLIKSEKAKQAEFNELIAKANKNIKDFSVPAQPRKSKDELFEDKIKKETDKTNQKNMVGEKMEEEIKEATDRGEMEGWSANRIEQEQDQIISRWHQFIQKNII